MTADVIISDSDDVTDGDGEMAMVMVVTRVLVMKMVVEEDSHGGNRVLVMVMVVEEDGHGGNQGVGDEDGGESRWLWW